MRKDNHSTNGSTESSISSEKVRVRAPITKRMMNDKFFSRLNSEVEFMCKTSRINGIIPTCRSCANFIDISKSTVHLDITKRFSYLLYLGIPLKEDGYKYLTKYYFNKVTNILKANSEEKYIRGGEAYKKVLLRRREEANHECK